MVTRCRPLLGTFVEITVPDGTETEFVDRAFATIAHIHEHMSFHSENSDIAKLRNAPPGRLVKVHADTVAVLRRAAGLHRETGGLFDETIGAELVHSGFLPAPSGFARGQIDGTADDIELVDDCHIRCHRRVLIDLGGIAKGYAVDRAIAILVAGGVPEGLVNAGGDMRMFGERFWDVALRDADNSVRSAIQLGNCAVASSANLRHRRRRLMRRVTPHIGRGRRSVLAAGRVSVIADDCTTADAMTKVALVDRTLAECLLRDKGGRLLSQADFKKAA